MSSGRQGYVADSTLTKEVVPGHTGCSGSAEGNVSSIGTEGNVRSTGTEGNVQSIDTENSGRNGGYSLSQNNNKLCATEETGCNRSDNSSNCAHLDCTPNW